MLLPPLKKGADDREAGAGDLLLRCRAKTKANPP
jgi:hypothetical protein